MTELREWIEMVALLGEQRASDNLSMRLNESVDINSNAFKQWFRKSKVVNQRGQPLVCYHGTAFGGEVESFKTLSHFGTLKAAQDRIDSKLEEPKGPFHPDYDKEISPHVYPVYLRIEKPLFIPDCGMPPYGKFDPDKVLRFMASKHNRIITQKRAREIVANRERIWTVIQNLGYDGAAYRNAEEDRGSTSWIIFNSNQVWPLYSDEPDRVET